MQLHRACDSAAAGPEVLAFEGPEWRGVAGLDQGLQGPVRCRVLGQLQDLRLQATATFRRNFLHSTALTQLVSSQGKPMSSQGLATYMADERGDMRCGSASNESPPCPSGRSTRAQGLKASLCHRSRTLQACLGEHPGWPQGDLV